MSRPCLTALLLLLTATGCRTANSDLPSLARLRAQVGQYTFDEAVRQMGPPARKTELGDHSLVAEWEAGTSSQPSFSFGLGSSSGSVATGAGTTVGGKVTHIYRQLQFDQTGKLALVQDVTR
jgi:hypothetical protein